MSSIKKVWLVKHDDLIALSFESSKIDFNRLHVSELMFPDKPTKAYPKRHTLCLKYLDMNDLETIMEAIQDYIDKNGEEAL